MDVDVYCEWVTWVLSSAESLVMREESGMTLELGCK